MVSAGVSDTPAMERVMVLEATNWVFNIVALNPLFISLDEKFVDLVE